MADEKKSKAGEMAKKGLRIAGAAALGPLGLAASPEFSEMASSLARGAKAPSGDYMNEIKGEVKENLPSHTMRMQRSERRERKPLRMEQKMERERKPIEEKKSMKGRIPKA
jgi:hypothetical protein